MGNICFLADNRIPDAGSYSGGSWVAGLPLTNLQNQLPKCVARSTNALTTSTKFVLDLGQIAPLQMFALINHNFSSGATVRIRAGNASDGSGALIDVTLVANAPNIIYGSLPWGAFPWSWFTSDSQPGGATLFYKNASAVYARYILIDIVDASNTAGYVQFGRFLAGVPFVPTYNYNWGAGLGLNDGSVVARAIDGSLYSDVRPKRRTLTGTLGWLSEAEAVGSIYALQSRVGVSVGILAVENPDDTDGTLAAKTIYGTLSTPAPLQQQTEIVEVPYSWTYALEELV